MAASVFSAGNENQRWEQMLFFPVKSCYCYRIPEERVLSIPLFKRPTQLPFMCFHFLHFSFEKPWFQTGPKKGPIIRRYLCFLIHMSRLICFKQSDGLLHTRCSRLHRLHRLLSGFSYILIHKRNIRQICICPRMYGCLIRNLEREY
jgi:hypothetical protein